jgi:hypothetical protein
LALFPIIDAAAIDPSSPPIKATVVEVARWPKHFEASPIGVAFSKSRYFVSDRRANKVLVVDADGNTLHALGRVGSGRGELLRPSQIRTTATGSLVVWDMGNERLQVWDLQGKYLRELHLPDFTFFTTIPSGELVISRPENGAVASVYDINGTFVRKFGALKKTSDIYGSDLKKDDDRNRALINRITLTATNDGAMYLAFAYAPIVQKYSADGRLLWETRLAGKEMEELASLFKSDEGRIGHKYIRDSMDGRTANRVTSGIVVDNGRKRLYVLLPNRYIMALNTDGKQLGVLPLHVAPGSGSQQDLVASTLALIVEGRITIVDPFSDTLWQGEVPIP